MANYESGFDLTHVLGKGVNHEVFKCLNLFFQFCNYFTKTFNVVYLCFFCSCHIIKVTSPFQNIGPDFDSEIETN